MRPALVLTPALASLLLAACALGNTSVSGAAPAPVGCHADAARFAVGYAYTEALAAEALTRSGAKLVRVLRPDQPVTMEFNEERINLEVDAGNRVAKVRCG